jgi:hypothetical protein
VFIYTFERCSPVLATLVPPSNTWITVPPKSIVWFLDHPQPRYCCLVSATRMGSLPCFSSWRSRPSPAAPSQHPIHSEAMVSQRSDLRKDFPREACLVNTAVADSSGIVGRGMLLQSPKPSRSMLSVYGREGLQESARALLISY